MSEYYGQEEYFHHKKKKELSEANKRLRDAFNVAEKNLVNLLLLQDSATPEHIAMIHALSTAVIALRDSWKEK